MKKIIISTEAKTALFFARDLRRDWKETATPNNDGTWTVPFEDETLDAMKARQFPGESLSDTIIRLCQFTQSGGKLQ